VSTARRPAEPTASLPSRLREVYEEHGPFVCRSLRHLGAPEADLDDLLQEVFLVVHKRLQDYEEKGRARSWLYSICVRVTHAHRRKTTRSKSLLGKEREGPSEQSAPPSQLEQLQDRESLAFGLRLLEQLPPEQREVFVLYEVEDMKMTEIAQAVGSPLQTVYSRLYKARERIMLAVRGRASESEP